MPKARSQPTDKIAQLRQLADTPAEQLEYALQLVKTESHLELLQAALAIITEVAEPKARPVLLERYRYYDSDGTKLDPGCYLRVAILQALQPLARVEDIPLLERAVSTYEYLPPGRGEVAIGLRAIGLVTLNEIEETLAGYYATRLLIDPQTSKMSGEPAVTAAKVLATQGQYLPLYAYAIREGESRPEVVGECLRSLTRLPSSLLPTLIDRYEDSNDEIMLLGLFDLLLTHPDNAKYTGFIFDFLAETRLLNLYRYLVIDLVARKQQDDLKKLLASTKDPTRTKILQEALGITEQKAKR